MLTRLLLAALLTLLLADSALATTASLAPGGVLQITTASGEANAIVVERDAAGPVLVRETGAPLLAGAGCHDRPDMGGVLCPGTASLDIDTGDGDDSVTLRDAEGFPDELPAKVAGGDGTDVLTAGESPAELSGGQGDDTIAGGLGADRLDGGAGDDTIAGGFGADRLDGGAGDDRLTGGAGFDELAGGAGNDVAEYTDAAVHTVLLGGDGDDRVAADVETVLGGPAADTLTGTAAAERLAGAEGADLLRGEGGDDTLEGGSGADRIVAGSGADAVDAGDGDDAIDVRDGAADTVACGPGDDAVSADDVDVAAPDCEHVDRGPVLAPCGTAAGASLSCDPPECPPGAVRREGSCVVPPNPCGRTSSSSARVVACAPPPGRLTLAVSGPRRQRAGRRVAVSVRCSITCTASARAVVGRVRLSSPTRTVPAGRGVTLRLRAKRSLAGRRLRIVVTARDATGRAVTARRTVRLR